MMRLRGCRV